MKSKSPILNSLVHSCIGNDIKSFIPYLLDFNVFVAFSNKVKFYSYLKKAVGCAQEKKIGKLKAVIEKPYEYNFKGGQNLSFYDEGHQHPLMVLEFKEENECIYLDVHPF